MGLSIDTKTLNLKFFRAALSKISFFFSLNGIQAGAAGLIVVGCFGQPNIHVPLVIGQ
jgi:hypothetical protein